MTRPDGAIAFAYATTGRKPTPPVIQEFTGTATQLDTTGSLFIGMDLARVEQRVIADMAHDKQTYQEFKAQVFADIATGFGIPAGMLQTYSSVGAESSAFAEVAKKANRYRVLWGGTTGTGKSRYGDYLHAAKIAQALGDWLQRDTAARATHSNVMDFL